MRRASAQLLAPGILVAIVLLVLSLVSPGSHAAPPTPILVELFTSEGCSDCPPADTLLEALTATQPIGGADIIALGQHVDYWDRLGWKDRFSSAALTERQQLYQARFRTESIYTPQMVVDGRAEFVGSDTNAARRAIERALTAPHGIVRIDIDADGARPFDPDVERPFQDRQDSNVGRSFQGRPDSNVGRSFQGRPDSDVGRPFQSRQDSDVGRSFQGRQDSDVGRSFRGRQDSDVGRPFQGRPDLQDRLSGDPERVALHLTESVGLQVTVSDLPHVGRGDRADVVVAVTESHLRSDVKRGENRGRTLAHAAVVRYMAAIGQAASDRVSSVRANIPLAVDWHRDQLKVAAFVQELRSRTILASAAVSLQNTRR